MTLVEMLVATAMCIAGMWMLTWMFQQATASFSLANQQATLTGHERLITTLLTRDLDQDRFPEDDAATTNRGRRLSDFNFASGQRPQRGGYFIARSNAARAQTGANLLEGPSPSYADLYGFGSARYTDHFIQFTTILQDTPGNRYYAEVQVLDPANSTTTQLRTTSGVAAEISYYLRDTGTRTTNGVPLYDLMRVQRLVALNTYDARDYLRLIVTPGYRADNPDEVMVCSKTPDTMYTLANLAGPTDPVTGLPTGPVWTNAPRFTPGGIRTTGRRVGEDRLMTNVVSFEVKFTGDTVSVPPINGVPAWPVPQPGDQTPPSPDLWPRPLLNNSSSYPPTYQGNSDYPYDNLPYADGRFDSSDPFGSAANNQVPTRRGLNIRGIQIRIRAFSGGTTRQTTLTIAL